MLVFNENCNEKNKKYANRPRFLIKYFLSRQLIRFAKKKNPGTQLQNQELFLIAKVVARYLKPDILIFGLGYDAPLYGSINTKGRTVFLEDDKEWFNKITQLCPSIEAYLITYPTKISQWKILLGKNSELELKLPDSVTSTTWDIILVDAPCGAYDWHMQKYGIEPPGRMASIYTASRLIRKGGDVFVHDCDRLVEQAYSDRYLSNNNLKKQVKGRAILRHYKMLNT